VKGGPDDRAGRSTPLESCESNPQQNVNTLTKHLFVFSQNNNCHMPVQCKLSDHHYMKVGPSLSWCFSSAVSLDHRPDMENPAHRRGSLTERRSLPLPSGSSRRQRFRFISTSRPFQTVRCDPKHHNRECVRSTQDCNAARYRPSWFNKPRRCRFRLKISENSAHSPFQPAMRVNLL
jgi:hypothetical protein